VIKPAMLRESDSNGKLVRPSDSVLFSEGDRGYLAIVQGRGAFRVLCYLRSGRLRFPVQRTPCASITSITFGSLMRPRKWSRLDTRQNV
jgi:hypothetical protein